MRGNEHSPFIENIPAYALGALDVGDIAALESHLKTCASCRTELAEYRAVGESLLTAIPPKQPSAALRKRLQNRLPGTQRSSRLQIRWSFGQFAMGAAVIALLVVNLFSFAQLRRLQVQQASLVNQVENAQIALAVLSSPNIQLLPISGENISGTLLLDKDRNKAVLIAEDFPVLAENQIYQIWLIQPDEQRVSAGLFRPRIGQSYTTQDISSEQDISSFIGIGVTIEPAAGSDQPTGSRVFRIDF